MAERSGGARENLIVLALVAILAIQLYYVLTRSPRAQSPSPGASGILVNEPTPLAQVIKPTASPVIPTGSIRLGTPAASTPGAATADPGEPSAPGEVAAPQPVQPSPPEPVKPTEPTPVNPDPSRPQTTATPTPQADGSGESGVAAAPGRPVDPYRRALLAIYYLEQSPEHALSQSQARQLLTFVEQMEGLRKVVPGAQSALDATLTKAQKDWMREQAGKVADGQKAFAPERTAAYAEKILSEGQ